MSTQHDPGGHSSARPVAAQRQPAQDPQKEQPGQAGFGDPDTRGGGGGPTAVRRALVGFGRFWWDFLIGDTPELFVGMLVVLGAGGAMVAVGLRALAWLMVPLLVIAVLTASVMHGRQQR